MLLEIKDIYKRPLFRSYSEVYLALAIGKALSDRGNSLSFENMSIAKDCLPKDIYDYFISLVSKKVILLPLAKEVPVQESKLSFNTLIFDSMKSNTGTIEWCMGEDSYRDIYLKDLQTSQNFIMHLVGTHICNVLLGKTTKKLVLNFKGNFSKTTSYYINIYSCLMTLSWLNDFIQINTDINIANLEYSIFCNNGLVAGHQDKKLTPLEKKELMSKFGIEKGSICILWERWKMNENNLIGVLKDQPKVIRIDGIGADSIIVTSFPLNKTKEKLEQEYEDLEDYSKYLLYSNGLSYNINSTVEEIDLIDLGIDDYFYCNRSEIEGKTRNGKKEVKFGLKNLSLIEPKFITLIDEFSKSSHLITLNGVKKEVVMSEVDAIYWLLNQYEIDFDSKLYKRMYSNGNDLLWDYRNEE